MMHATYLATLLISLAGLTTLDYKYKLAFFGLRRRASICIGVALIAFFAWDALGIALGIFLHGNSRFSLTFVLFPQFPLEEIFFLLLLCYVSLLSYVGIKRRYSA